MLRFSCISGSLASSSSSSSSSSSASSSFSFDPSQLSLSVVSISSDLWRSLCFSLPCAMKKTSPSTAAGAAARARIPAAAAAPALLAGPCSSITLPSSRQATTAVAKTSTSATAAAIAVAAAADASTFSAAADRAHTPASAAAASAAAASAAAASAGTASAGTASAGTVSAAAASAAAASAAAASAAAASAAAVDGRQVRPASFFLARAAKCLASFPPDFALHLKLLLKGVQHHGDHVPLLVRAAEALCEEGEWLRAQQLLQRAIDLEPEGDPTKYLILAQMEEGRASLLLYRKAVALLQQQLASLGANENEVEIERKKESEQKKKKKKKEEEGRQKETKKKEGKEEDEEEDVKKKLAETYCSIAELFMTDLCDDAAAEEEVQRAVAAALILAPRSPDVLHVRASYLKVIGQLEEARATAQAAAKIIFQQLHARSSSLISPAASGAAAAFPAAAAAEKEEAMKRCAGDTGLFSSAAEQDGEVFAAAGEVTSRETRINLARVLIDVEETETAVVLVSSCLQEDEQDADAWMVLACALLKAKAFTSCREALEHLQQLLQRGVPEQQALQLHATELLNVLEKEEEKEREEEGSMMTGDAPPRRKQQRNAVAAAATTNEKTMKKKKKKKKVGALDAARRRKDMRKKEEEVNEEDKVFRREEEVREYEAMEEERKDNLSENEAEDVDMN